MNSTAVCLKGTHAVIITEEYCTAGKELHSPLCTEKLLKNTYLYKCVKKLPLQARPQRKPFSNDYKQCCDQVDSWCSFSDLTFGILVPHLGSSKHGHFWIAAAYEFNATQIFLMDSVCPRWSPILFRTGQAVSNKQALWVSLILDHNTEAKLPLLFLTKWFSSTSFKFLGSL